MTFVPSSSNLVDAERIPYVTADEAFSLLQTSFERFMKVIESLNADDWTKPTACTDWNVHDIVAHQAGGFVSGTNYKEMIRIIRLYTSKVRPGRLPEDTVNTFQVKERADKSPTELIAELRQAGPIAIQNWAYRFRLIKPIVTSHPIGGVKSLRYFLWIIHSRDTWMHRLDICRATGHHFEQTREHDGRINELVVLDLAQSLKNKVGKRALNLVLTGTTGGAWKIGQTEPEATIEMDMLNFNIYASGRFNHEDGLSRAKLWGDKNLAQLALKNFMVLY
jgi:uncharacterized protein (TIGR03083 family)